MAKRKPELIARVRYIKGKPDAEKRGKWDEDEQFCIETYDEETKTWNLDTATRCVHAREYNTETADYIHFSILKRVLQMLSWGYSFHEAKGGGEE